MLILGIIPFVVGLALYFGLRKEIHAPVILRYACLCVSVVGLCMTLYGLAVFDDEAPTFPKSPTPSMSRPR